MKEIKENSFIFECHEVIQKSMCEQIINRFEEDKDGQYRGKIGQTFKSDESIKKSTDIFISGKDHWKDVDQLLFNSLASALSKIRKKYEFFNGPFKDCGYGIQKTSINEYYSWHIDGGSHEFSKRQLVAIWYLNDLESNEGGETEFEYQKIQIRPEAGKLILFPPFWTHRHQGAPVKIGTKYIATTWIVFA